MVLASEQLEDLLFAVKRFQRLPFLISIVWMHLFLFVFFLEKLSKEECKRENIGASLEL